MKATIGLFFLSILLFPFTTLAENGSLIAPNDYRVTKVADNLTNPNSFTYDFDGNYIVVESIDGYNRIVRVNANAERVTLLDRLVETIIGISFYQGKLYVVT